MTYEEYLQLLEELNNTEIYRENYREHIQKFKKSIKLIAGYIKSLKTNSEEEFSKENGFLPLDGFDPSYQARHMNIAYGMVRGKTMKQIENKVREGNEPNMAFVANLTKMLMVDEKYLTFDWGDSPKLKMYVLVRKDLAPDHRMVQGGHAVAQYLLDHKEEHWKNGTMVYVAVDVEADLIIWERKLREAGKKYSSFTEPDWGAPTQTAIACVDTGEIFEGLPLLTTRNMSRKGLFSKILAKL